LGALQDSDGAAHHRPLETHLAGRVSFYIEVDAREFTSIATRWLGTPPAIKAKSGTWLSGFATKSRAWAPLGFATQLRTLRSLPRCLQTLQEISA